MNTHQLYYRCSKRPCPVEDLRWWLFLLPAINPVCTCAEGLEVVVFFVTGGGGFLLRAINPDCILFCNLIRPSRHRIAALYGVFTSFSLSNKKRYTTLRHIREKKKRILSYLEIWNYWSRNRHHWTEASQAWEHEQTKLQACAIEI